MDIFSEQYTISCSRDLKPLLQGETDQVYFLPVQIFQAAY